MIHGLLQGIMGLFWVIGWTMLQARALSHRQRSLRPQLQASSEIGTLAEANCADESL